MGSFSYTCSYSGLPIESGDKIRFMLLTEAPYKDSQTTAVNMHDLWIPRTFPLVGKYNDYGSVDNYETGPLQKTWIEGLRLDMNEKGWGDNRCHDVPVLKDMTFEQMLDAIREGRLDIIRSEKRDSEKIFGKDSMSLLLDEAMAKEQAKWEPDEGIPTLTRLMKLFQSKDLPLFKTDGSKDGFMIDEEFSGSIRIRWSSYDEGGVHVEQLKKAIDVVEGKYAAMMTCGSGNYATAVEVLVRPKPGLSKNKTNLSLMGPNDTLVDNMKKPLAVAIAMFREDVWQALLDVSHNHRKGEIGWRYHGTDKKEPNWDEAARAKWEEDVARRKKPEDDSLSLFLADRDLERGYGLGWEGKWSPGNDGVYHVGLGSHWKLMVKKAAEDKLTPEQIDSFLRVAVDIARVQEVMSVTRYYWRPSNSCGPQYGCWDSSAIVLKKLAEIAENRKRQRAIDAGDDDAEDEEMEAADAAKKAKKLKANKAANKSKGKKAKAKKKR
jgi:hypothetical protein